MRENNITKDEIVQSPGWRKMMNRMDLYCSFFLLALIVLFSIGYTNNNNFRILTIATIMMMASIGFFLAFEKFNSESLILSKWFYRIYGIGLMLSFITLLAVYQVWNFPIELSSFISVILLIVSLIFGIREMRAGNKNKINWKFFLRLFIALVPIIYLMIHRIL